MKCFHATTEKPTCTRDAIVLASDSGRMLRQDLPLCGGCAPGYARQAAESAMEWLKHGLLPTDGPITITLRPLKADDPTRTETTG